MYGLGCQSSGVGPKGLDGSLWSVDFVASTEGADTVIRAQTCFGRLRDERP